MTTTHSGHTVVDTRRLLEKESVQKLLKNNPLKRSKPIESVEVRNDEHGIDEIVARGVAVFHLEYMEDNQVWIGLTLRDGKTFHIDLSARGKITTMAEYR